MRRAEIAMASSKKMSHILAKQRVVRGLRQKFPIESDRMLSSSDNLLLWRDNLYANSIVEWIGPCNVEGMTVDKKLVFVRDATIGPAKPFNLTQVKPYYNLDKASELFLSELKLVLDEFKTPEDYTIHLTEILRKEKPRIDTPEMRSAQYKEIRGFMDRGSF